MTGSEVLIIDDDSSMRLALEQLFELEGYQPTACSGAEQALELMAEKKFSAVISDINMPNMFQVLFG